MTLGILVNWLAGALLAFTIFFYVVIYTMWLKRWTPQNIVIGGAAGALPPVVAGPRRPARSSVEPLAAVPHHLLLDAAAFLGAGAVPQRRLCPRRRADAAGGRRPDATRRQILLYTIVLVAVALAPWPLGYFGAVYGVTSLVLGAGMLCARDRRLSSAAKAPRPRAPREELFGFSILYLFALFAVLLPRSSIRAHCTFGRGRGRMGSAMDEQARTEKVSSSPRRRSAAAAQRSIAIALALGVLVVLFFAVTMVKGPAFCVRPM